MHQVIYSSRGTWPLSDAELVGLLTQARENNARQGITGVLFYGSQLFLQVLEGEQETITALCDKLRRDPRHTGLVYLAEKPIAQRSFNGWAMGFQQIPPTATEGLEGVLSEAQLATQLGRMAAADRLLMDTMRRLLRPVASN